MGGLGRGYHYGEWWGRGIQRGYGLKERRFSLFNVERWRDAFGPFGPGGTGNNAVWAPDCCRVVPVLYRGAEFDTLEVHDMLDRLSEKGSYAAPAFMRPEGGRRATPAERPSVQGNA